MYICTDDGYIAGVGKTLRIAFDTYVDNGGDEPIEDCVFWDASPIEVEVRIEKKEVPVKVVKPNVKASV